MVQRYSKRTKAQGESWTLILQLFLIPFFLFGLRSVYSGVPGGKSILTYLDANDFLSIFAVEANTSVIDVNDLIFENVRQTKTEENDIIVSRSNNKQYSVPVLSDCKTDTKTGWKRKLSYSAFLALQTWHSTFQFLQVVLMESHVAVFLSLCFCLLILSLLCPYPVSQCLYHYLPACVPSTPEGWAQRLWQREVWVDEITC